MSDTPVPRNPVDLLFEALVEHVDGETLEDLRLDFERDGLRYTRALLDLPDDALLPEAAHLMQLIHNLLSHLGRDYERGVRDGKRSVSVLHASTA